MSRTEPELWTMLREADAMSHGEAQQAIMEDVVRHADAGGFHRLAFTARRVLAGAYSVDRQWHKAFPLFSRCLSEYDRRPWQFGPEEEWSLREWYTNIAQSMSEFPEISLDQIYAAFTDMERRFATGGHSLRPVHAARRWVAQLAGDWDEEERCYQAWIAAGGPDPDSVWDFEAGVERLVLRGDDVSLARARALAEPVLAGQRTFHQPSAPIQCLMMLPLVRAGATGEAVLAYRRSIRSMERGVYRYEYSGMHVEFCALTGNDAEGLHQLQRRLRGFSTLNRPNGKMEFAASAAVLLRLLVADGRGEEVVKRGYGTDAKATIADLHIEMDGIARDLAAKFDARNGSTSQGDRVRERLDARPVLDFLPLTPTSRPPRTPAVAPGTPPEQVLDRAEWHLRAEEFNEAKRALKALPQPVPPHLAARAAEARAVADQADDGDTTLGRAAEEYGRTGEARRHLMCRVRLARWLSAHGRAAEGAQMAGAAIRQMGAACDTWALAWGELDLGRILRMTPDKRGSHAAMARAAWAAAESGDPLAVGVVAVEHAAALNRDGADPADAIRHALVARDALLPIGANRMARSAFLQLRRAHVRAGREGEYLALVRAQLDALPPGTHPSVRGFLRYDHGESLLAADRFAEAARVLTDALADLSADGLDRPDQWYRLATACFRAERYEDAVHAAESCVTWMYNLREKGELDRPDLADDCRLLLATAYRLVGDDAAAEEEFVKAIEVAQETGYRSALAKALGGLGLLLADHDRHDEAAARLTEAGDAYEAMGDPHQAVLVRANAALAWDRSGETDQALAAFAAAERTVGGVPPDRRRSDAASSLGSTGAVLLAGLGRGPEAVRYAAQAATAYRQSGNPAKATDMDVLHAKILLSDGRPDLARQLADSLAQQGLADAAEAVRGAVDAQ